MDAVEMDVVDADVRCRWMERKGAGGDVDGEVLA